MSNKISFKFISEPTDTNYNGKVHGGVVMRWIDQAAYTCARNWAENYCVTVYVGGIKFLKPINIGDIVRVDATVIHTGNTSIHIAVDVHSRNFKQKEFEKNTHCVIIFVSVDDNGKPTPVKSWEPISDAEKRLEDYAKKLKALHRQVDDEMQPFLS